MNEATNNTTTRREFLKNTGYFAAASALTFGCSTTKPGHSSLAVPAVHPGENNTIQIALVGCGGRGGGAAANALSVQNGPIKIVAMADVFDFRLNSTYDEIKKAFADKVEVPEDRRFVGLEAYKKAMDCLKPGDIVILATPPAFRWVQFTYAIEKGLNVFMEKPVTVDGPSTRRMFKLAEQAEQKNLKVAVGLMCRHCRTRKQLFDRIKAGEIGDIILMQAYRMHGPVGTCFSVARNQDAEATSKNFTELQYQIRRFHSFLWASGGLFNDFYIHNIDECCWMKDSFPVKARALGGRQYRGNHIDQNFDTYSVEYTFDDGATLMLTGRTMTGCQDEFSSCAHGSKGMAVISTAAHSPTHARIFKGQKITKAGLLWSAAQPEADPYQLEWDDLIDAIRTDKHYNEVKRGAQASLVSSMGRMAAHTGQVITYDEILNSEHEFAPNLDKLVAFTDAAPLTPTDDGKYPIPQPGIVTKREY
jgi:predicted dehydrogenase